MKKIFIQGINYDEKSSFQKGSRFAPQAIREALHSGSSNYFTEDVVSIENPSIEDQGDFEIKEYFDIEKITRSNLGDGNKILTLGGDHSITFPILKAFHEVYSKIDILHIDAHADLYEEFEGDKYSHACPFARIMEKKLASRLVQVGIRTLNTHQLEQAERYHVEIHEMKSLNLKNIPEFKNPLYISVDMDGIDPAYAPGVSHQEPGGLSSRQVLDLIQSIDAHVIGADIVEYNPKIDVQNMTAFLGVKILKELLGKMMS